MNTRITDSTEEAAEYIRSGGVVAFPTETVYGLGADVFSQRAIERIFEAKQRPADNPLIVHISDISTIELVAMGVSVSARKFVAAFFPGPLTVVATRSDAVPPIVTAGLDTVGFRMPRNAIANKFISACGTPVAAPSANLSGRPSPTTWEAVLEDLDGRIDCVLRGNPTEIGIESTVVDCTVDPPVLLRAGAVSLEELRSVVPETDVYRLDDIDVRRSPGMAHRHYSPSARVIIVDSAPGNIAERPAAMIGVSPPDTVFEYSLICNSVDEYARLLFEFFRACDRRGIKAIYCLSVPEQGIGAALMDRLRRAAAE